jgi:hypothetical protein
MPLPKLKLMTSLLSFILLQLLPIYRALVTCKFTEALQNSNFTEAKSTNALNINKYRQSSKNQQNLIKAIKIRI